MIFLFSSKIFSPHLQVCKQMYRFVMKLLENQPYLYSFCLFKNEIFAALEKTCLIEDRDKCDYSRCGRTDKGVSAFGQVMILNCNHPNT